MSEETPEELRDRALACGYGDPAALDSAIQAFRSSASSDGFASFLMSRGVLTPDQVGDLAPAGDMGATMIDDEPQTLVGQSFSGWVIESKLGEGGMGSVYLALKGDEEVVVKFLAAEQAANPTWRARFLREAQVMQRIAHPNIVGIHSVEGESDKPHIVMEFVDGEALDETLRGGPLEIMQATRIAHDIAVALAHAHAAGVIHRDIKPANVLVSRAGDVKVLDFGLAKNVEQDDGLSMPGQILGTPQYMAPEQWGDHAVDARCDVFSLGAMLFHLLTGQVPFPGKSPGVISRKVLEGVFPPPSALNPRVPEDLELVIFRMMDRDRAYRYASAKECAEDLQRVIEGRQVDDVPRLIEQGGERHNTRYALLPGDSFVLGRDDTCDVPLSDRSVSRQHARIERGKTGYVIHDLGSTYGTFVGGMRVRNVVLKDKDEVRCGKVVLHFHDGGLGQAVLSTRRLAPDRMRVRSIPLPLMRCLINAGDKRAVVTLLEGLAPKAVEDRVALARTMLRLRLGGELAEQAAGVMERSLHKMRRRIPARLFSITHENLAGDVESWLGWWDQARPRYPAQLAPQHPHAPARLEVVAGEPQRRAIALEEKHAVFEIGREKGKQVQLDSRSVSRLHATLLRFHKRYILRDEGSRFGTLLNGQKIRMSFIRPGDRIVLGKVELEFQTDQPDPSATHAGEGLHEIDAVAFNALVELNNPATAAGLVRFLVELAAGLGWVEEEALRLFPKARDRQEAFVGDVRAMFEREAEQARSVLPKLLGEDAGDDAASWQRLLHDRQADLPAQLYPQGWFPVGAH